MNEAMIESPAAELTEELEEELAGPRVECPVEFEADFSRAFSYGASGTGDETSAGAEDEPGEEPEDRDDGEGEGRPAPEQERVLADAGETSELERDVWPYGGSEVDPGRPPSRKISTKELGKRGENAATNYLVRKGYRILERNWTCKFGEADIIAMDDDGTVVFVEVKTRRSVDAGLPEEAVTREKQRRYEKLALTYMIDANWNDDVNLRFDTIGICVTGDFQAILKHHQGCFDGSY